MMYQQKIILSIYIDYQCTGLDPAGPEFDDKDKAVRLNKDDAKLVDVIHTDGLSWGWDKVLGKAITLGMHFGTMVPMGHVDFYPNQGRMQPGCDDISKWIQFVFQSTISQSFFSTTSH